MGTADDSRSQKQAIKEQGVDVASILDTVEDIEEKDDILNTNDLLGDILASLLRLEEHMQVITDEEPE